MFLESSWWWLLLQVIMFSCCQLIWNLHPPDSQTAGTSQHKMSEMDQWWSMMNVCPIGVSPGNASLAAQVVDPNNEQILVPCLANIKSKWIPSSSDNTKDFSETCWGFQSLRDIFRDISTTFFPAKSCERMGKYSTELQLIAHFRSEWLAKQFSQRNLSAEPKSPTNISGLKSESLQWFFLLNRISCALTE